MPKGSDSTAVELLAPASRTPDAKRLAVHAALARAAFHATPASSSTEPKLRGGGLKGVGAAGEAAAKSLSSASEGGRAVSDNVAALSSTLETYRMTVSGAATVHTDSGAPMEALARAAQAMRLTEDAGADFAAALREKFSSVLGSLHKEPGKGALDTLKKFDKVRDKAVSTKQKADTLEAQEKASVAKMAEAEAAAKTAYTAYEDAIGGTMGNLHGVGTETHELILKQSLALYDQLFSIFLEGHAQMCELRTAEVAAQMRSDARAALSECESASRENSESSSDDAASPGLRSMRKPLQLEGTALIKQAREASETVASSESDDDGPSSSSSSDSEELSTSERAASMRAIALEGLQSQRDKKRDVMEVLLLSEKQFVKDMEILQDTFAASIRKLALDEDSTKISTSDVSSIFGNSAKIAAVHKRFRYAVDEALDLFSKTGSVVSLHAASKQRSIGSVLSSFYDEFLPQYEAYTKVYAHAPVVLARLRRESKSLNSVLKAMERPQENLTLLNLLASPLRRIRAYGQYAQRLFDATPTSLEREYALLEELCEKFASLDHMLSSQSDAVAALTLADEAGQRLVGLPRVLSGLGAALPGEDFVHQGLRPDPSRRLVAQGSLNLLLPQGEDGGAADRAKLRKVYCFLFNDVIVVGTISKSKLLAVSKRVDKPLESVKYLQHIYTCDAVVFDPDVDSDANDDVISAAGRVPNSFALRRDVPAHERPTSGALPGLGPGSPVTGSPVLPKAPAPTATKGQLEMDGIEPEEFVFCFDTPALREKWMNYFREGSAQSRRGRTFNMPLEDLMTSPDDHARNFECAVPWFISKLCAAIRQGKQLETEGLFRISGAKNSIKALRRKVQQGTAHGADFRTADVHTCSGLFKLFFREMPVPVFTYEFYDDWIACVQENDDRAAIAQAARVVLSKLPPFNQYLMEELFSLLRDTARCSEKNMMKPSNLAIVMSTNVLFKEGQSAFDTADYKTIYTLLEVMMEHFDDVFADEIPARADFEKTRVAAARAKEAKEAAELEELRLARKADKAKAETQAANIIRAAEEREAAERARLKAEQKAQQQARKVALKEEALAAAAAEAAAAEAIAQEEAKRRLERKEAKAAAEAKEREQKRQAAIKAAEEKEARRTAAEREYEALLAREQEEVAAKAAARKAEASAAAAASASSQPTCAGCGKTIEKGGLAAVDKKWHRECFVCQKCRGALSGKFVRGKDGMPYCNNCFAQQAGAGSCKGCGKPIAGQFFRAMGGTWHPTGCFVCTNCKGPLTEGFFDKGGQPFCKNCK